MSDCPDCKEGVNRREGGNDDSTYSCKVDQPEAVVDVHEEKYDSRLTTVTLRDFENSKFRFLPGGILGCSGDALRTVVRNRASRLTLTIIFSPTYITTPSDTYIGRREPEFLHLSPE
jgi:hypothetical protein